MHRPTLLVVLLTTVVASATPIPLPDVLRPAGAKPVPADRVQQALSLRDGKDVRILALDTTTYVFEDVADAPNRLRLKRYTDAVEAAGGHVRLLGTNRNRNFAQMLIDFPGDVRAVVKANETTWTVVLADVSVKTLRATLDRTCRADVHGLAWKPGKPVLKADSDDVLRRLVALFEGDPALRAELGDEAMVTDVRHGDLRLSKARAEVVKDWLMKAGVDGRRLTTEGYADTHGRRPRPSGSDRRLVVKKADCTPVP
jgi:hypothetical protein